MADDKYKKEINAEIAKEKQNLEANKIPPVTKANIQRQAEITQKIQNLKNNLND